MKKGPLRIIASLLLVVTLLTLSGLTATAGTLAGAGASNSCCGHGCDDAPAPGPCSTPDCPCFSCASMIVYPLLSIQRNSDECVLSLVAPRRYQLSAYIRSIDYPPENV